MPEILRIPLIGLVQMAAGAAIVVFILIKYLTRPGKNKPGELIIKNVHIITGDGTQAEGQNVYIKNGVIADITDKPLSKKICRSYSRFF